MNRAYMRLLILVFMISSTVTVTFNPCPINAGTCRQWVAKVVSVQGDVQILRAGEIEWKNARLHDTFCPGDMIKVMENSRASILLTNETILPIDQNTTITFSKPEDEELSVIDLIKGRAYFISHTPQRFRIYTPFLNAYIDGTEFFMDVNSDRTFITVFEGKVSVMNEIGGIALTSGQSAVAEKGQPPVLRLVVRPWDAVHWALYYPLIFYSRPGIPLEAWEKQIAFFLSVGRVDEASEEIEKMLRVMPMKSQALAIQSIIAVVQNEKEKALTLARQAIEYDPDYVPAKIALSYALQCAFDLNGALAALKDAVKLEPENALAWAQLSEIWLSFGKLDEALKAANRAVVLDPNLARTHTVLGFARLSQIKTEEARTSFEKAIKLDQADPLPRLGLGLLKIREGKLEDGRQEIKIAASLDPDNPLIRSYLGKAYYEEKRDKEASGQLSVAKALDPSDPTPFFYDAIRKQSINRPVEALKDLQKAIMLNDNRAVFRSRLLLDSDLAARSASLGRIYTDLGFQQLALVEGWKSVNVDPVNYSAKRFLADSYSALPRHEIARVSELLQSQLLQPVNITPVQPSLGEANLLILNDAGPTDLSFNEFNPLFNRNRFALQLNSIVGNNGIFGDEIVHSAVYRELSYSIGQFHYKTNGFRINNDLEQDIYNLFYQLSLSHNTSIQTEFRIKDIDKGDLELRFSPDDFRPDCRQIDRTKSLRLGFHHAFAPGSDFIASIIYQDLKSKIHDKIVQADGSVDIWDLEEKGKGYFTEVQYLFRSARFNIVSGGGYSDGELKTAQNIFPPPVGMPPLESESTEEEAIRHTNLYLYSQINYPTTMIVSLGGSFNSFKDSLGDSEQFNPKAGLTWKCLPATTLRLAAFRTLARSFISYQTIEPTQVSGFSQFFDDPEATDTWRFGIAVDQKFSDDLFGGVEYSQRDLEVPFIPPPPIFNPPDPNVFSPPDPNIPFVTEIRWVDWKERLGRTYLYWTPHKWFALSAEFQYELFDRDEEFVQGIEYVKTRRIPLGINFYHPSGFFTKFKAIYINQDGRFVPQCSELGAEPVPGNSNFWIFNAAAGYRLPKRLGIITFGVKNLFDRSFKYQDTDFENPAIQPARSVFIKAALAF